MSVMENSEENNTEYKYLFYNFVFFNQSEV